MEPLDDTLPAQAAVGTRMEKHQVLEEPREALLNSPEMLPSALHRAPSRDEDQ